MFRLCYDFKKLISVGDCSYLQFFSDFHTTISGGALLNKKCELEPTIRTLLPWLSLRTNSRSAHLTWCLTDWDEAPAEPQSASGEGLNGILFYSPDIFPRIKVTQQPVISRCQFFVILFQIFFILRIHKFECRYYFFLFKKLS